MENATCIYVYNSGPILMTSIRFTFFVKWLSVETPLGQACSRPQDSGKADWKKLRINRVGTSSGEPGCFLSPSCTQSSLSSDWGRPVLEFHLFLSLGNQLSNHSLRGNTSFGSTLVFFSLDVSVKEQKWKKYEVCKDLLFKVFEHSETQWNIPIEAQILWQIRSTLSLRCWTKIVDLPTV